MNNSPTVKQRFRVCYVLYPYITSTREIVYSHCAWYFDDDPPQFHKLVNNLISQRLIIQSTTRTGKSIISLTDDGRNFVDERHRFWSHSLSMMADLLARPQIEDHYGKNKEQLNENRRKN